MTFYFHRPRDGMTSEELDVLNSISFHEQQGDFREWAFKEIMDLRTKNKALRDEMVENGLYEQKEGP